MGTFHTWSLKQNQIVDAPAALPIWKIMEYNLSQVKLLKQKPSGVVRMGKRNYLKLGAFLLAIFLFSITLYACGASVVSIPDTNSAMDQPRETSGRVLWGLWELNISPAGDITAMAVRSGSFHANVVDMLVPPNCNDCLLIQVQGFYPDEHRLEADITLRNWTDLYGNDVRGIMISDVGHDLYNADDYTALWDNGGIVEINPFKRFPADPGPYLFYPGAVETVHYSLKTPAPPQWASILVAVDASWPDPCPEPFNIGPGGKLVWGELNETGGTINCYVDVFTHMNPVETVVLDLTAIGGGEADLSYWDGVSGLVNYYAAFDIPFAGHSPGDYELWIKAQTDTTDTWLYDKISIELLPGSEIIPRPTVFDNMDYPFSQSAIAVKNGKLYALGATGLNIYTLGAHGVPAPLTDAAYPSIDVDRYHVYVGDEVAYGYFERWDYLASSLVVFDLSSPAEPLARGSMAGMPIIGDAVVKDEEYLVCSIPAWNRIATVDAVNLDKPVWGGSYSSFDVPWALELDGNNLFALHEGSGVGVYSVSDPISPSPKGELGWNDVMNLPLAVSDSRGYVWGNDGRLGIFSYANPAYPVMISKTTIKAGWDGDSITGLHVDGNYLYAWGDTCCVIGVSDPENPELVFEPANETLAPDTTNGIAFDGRFAYTPHDEMLELIRCW